jgi:hypothetical protein
MMARVLDGFEDFNTRARHPQGDAEPASRQSVRMRRWTLRRRRCRAAAR